MAAKTIGDHLSVALPISVLADGSTVSIADVPQQDRQNRDLVLSKEMRGRLEEIGLSFATLGRNLRHRARS